MKILVLSDSHAALRQMRHYLDVIRPDAVIHLGDYYDDALAMQEEYAHVRFHMVPGNCDMYRAPKELPRILYYDVGGVRLYMTHGHLHHVKVNEAYLLADARKAQAQAALYGHTHVPVCRQEPDGLWVLNPGSCGYGSTAGLMETKDNQIISCRLITEAYLEEMV